MGERTHCPECGRYIKATACDCGWAEQDAVTAMQSALRECAAQFRQYERHHTEKGALDKAATNARFAQLATTAANLPSLTPIQPVQQELREQIARIICLHDDQSPDSVLAGKPRWQYYLYVTDAVFDLIAAQGLRVVAAAPVAWRVKDYADGWILFFEERPAKMEAQMTGALMQPLYAPITAEQVMADKITPPWDSATVAALNEFQQKAEFHPFTCPNRGDGKHVEDPAWGGGDLGVLRATPEGWVCVSCDYTQKWAHSFMGEPRGDRS